ncbi:MAG: hypothetical protein HYX94_12220 [Chloroflexi bacterium]|nr:hypothetical protein [Chloroflexota bacterium]
MSKKSVRIDVSSEQLSSLRKEVFSNQRLSGEQRRRAVRRIMPLPTDGSHVDLYCDGNFVGTV